MPSVQKFCQEKPCYFKMLYATIKFFKLQMVFYYSESEMASGLKLLRKLNLHMYLKKCNHLRLCS